MPRDEVPIYQNITDFEGIAEIVIDNLNKMSLENIDASLAILKHACNFQTFQHKIVEKLQNLPQASLQELKFISEFIGDLDSKEEIQNNIIGHIQKKRFPKIAEKALSGSDSSLHLALQVIDFQKVSCVSIFC